jgi:hypothetical protein
MQPFVRWSAIARRLREACFVARAYCSQVWLNESTRSEAGWVGIAAWKGVSERVTTVLVRVDRGFDRSSTPAIRWRRYTFVSFPSPGVTRYLIWVALALCSIEAEPARPRAQTQKPEQGAKPAPRPDRALIVVGLPGDDDHAARFLELARTYRQWLTESLGFAEEGVRIVFGAAGEPSIKAGAATREAITEEAAKARAAVTPESRFWLIVLGHGNERGGHTFLHLPGPDLRDDELAKLFAGITCREQVFWITTSASGGFLSALSAKGRIVITATTADQEFNETEFPHALGEVCRQSAKDLDLDKDGKVSVWEVFLQLGKLVEARFAADERTPTEHALLDDNGDQTGTERPDGGEGKDEPKPQAAPKSRVADGELARKTFLPLPAQ